MIAEIQAPAAAAATIEEQLATIENESEIRVTMKDGREILGRFDRAQGAFPFLTPKAGEILVLHPIAPEFAELAAVAIVRDAAQIHRDRLERKFGEIAYRQPRTRDEYEETLWDLARQMGEVKAISDQSFCSPEGLAAMRRHHQLEAQFDLIADEIELAKSKRRWIRTNCARRAAGLPLKMLEKIAPIGECSGFQIDVPKPSDFHPDPKTRRKRSPKPAFAYYPRAEIEFSMRDAQRKAEKKTSSRERRERFAKIAAERRRELELGQYREAQLEREAREAAAQAPAAAIATPAPAIEELARALAARRACNNPSARVSSENMSSPKVNASAAAAALGRLGRAANTPAQRAAAKANGKKGGRPKGAKDSKPRTRSPNKKP